MTHVERRDRRVIVMLGQGRLLLRQILSRHTLCCLSLDRDSLWAGLELDLFGLFLHLFLWAVHFFTHHHVKFRLPLYLYLLLLLKHFDMVSNALGSRIPRCFLWSLFSFLFLAWDLVGLSPANA